MDCNKLICTVALCLLAVAATSASLSEYPCGVGTCPHGTICGQVGVDYGCCPMRHYTCSDFDHCCPWGYTCDIHSGNCYTYLPAAPVPMGKLTALSAKGNEPGADRQSVKKVTIAWVRTVKSSRDDNVQIQ